MTFFESKNLEQLNMKQLSLSSEKMQKKFVKLVNQHCDDLISDRPFDNMKQQVNLLKLKAVEIGMFGINIGCFVIFQAQDFETFFGIELNESNDENFEVTGVHRKQILQNIYVFPPLKDDVARFDVIRIGDKNLIEKLSQNKFRENSIAAEHGMFVVISKNEWFQSVFSMNFFNEGFQYTFLFEHQLKYHLCHEINEKKQKIKKQRIKKQKIKKQKINKQKTKRWIGEICKGKLHTPHQKRVQSFQVNS